MSYKEGATRQLAYAKGKRNSQNRLPEDNTPEQLTHTTNMLQTELLEAEFEEDFIQYWYITGLIDGLPQ